MSHKWDANLVRADESQHVSHQLGCEAFLTHLRDSLDDEQAPIRTRSAAAASLLRQQGQQRRGCRRVALVALRLRCRRQASADACLVVWVVITNVGGCSLGGGVAVPAG